MARTSTIHHLCKVQKTRLFIWNIAFIVYAIDHFTNLCLIFAQFKFWLLCLVLPLFYCLSLFLTISIGLFPPSLSLCPSLPSRKQVQGEWVSPSLFRNNPSPLLSPLHPHLSRIHSQACWVIPSVSMNASSVWRANLARPPCESGCGIAQSQSPLNLTQRTRLSAFSSLPGVPGGQVCPFGSILLGLFFIRYSHHLTFPTFCCVTQWD